MAASTHNAIYLYLDGSRFDNNELQDINFNTDRLTANSILSNSTVSSFMRSQGVSDYEFDDGECVTYRDNNGVYQTFSPSATIWPTQEEGVFWWVTIELVTPSTTCDCWIYLNGSLDRKETLDAGSSYYFGQFFWPYNNTCLTGLQTNLDGYLHTEHTYNSFTVPNYDFSIFYTYSDLSYDYTTTSNSITIQLNSITIPDANGYTWKLGSNTQTGLQVTFNSLEAGDYTITVSIKDRNNKEIGKGSVTVSISASKVWIYTGSQNGWQLAVPYIYTSSGWKEAQAYIYTDDGWKLC